MFALNFSNLDIVTIDLNGFILSLYNLVDNKKFG